MEAFTTGRLDDAFLDAILPPPAAAHEPVTPGQSTLTAPAAVGAQRWPGRKRGRYRPERTQVPHSGTIMNRAPVSDLRAELLSGAPAATVRVTQRSTEFSVLVDLPAELSADDVEGVRVHRSRRSGKLYICWGATAARAASTTPPLPPARGRTTATRAETGADAVAIAQFFAAGGAALSGEDSASETKELIYWRRAFIRGISAAARAAVSAALAATSVSRRPGHEDPRPLQPLDARKKDLPDHHDQDGVHALVTAQKLQAALVARFAEGSCHGGDRGVRCMRVLCKVDSVIENDRLVWEPERCSCEGEVLYADLYPFRARWPRRRVVLDHLADARECRNVIGASILAMVCLSLPSCTSVRIGFRSLEDPRAHLSYTPCNHRAGLHTALRKGCHHSPHLSAKAARL